MWNTLVVYKAFYKLAEHCMQDSQICVQLSIPVKTKGYPFHDGSSPVYQTETVLGAVLISTAGRLRT